MTRIETSAGEPLTVLDEPPRRGGESRVYAAVDASGRRVAVKVALLPLPAGAWLDEERALLATLAADPAIAPHVVASRGHGTWAFRPFFVMDWHPRTLVDYVAAGPPPDARIAMARRVCEAVAALHAARPGLVHRDIKPSNVLLDDDGGPRLADFGAAREASPERSLTVSAVRTPGWAPPEQGAPGPKRPTPAWDVYALAATVFFVVVGRAPGEPADRRALEAAVGRPAARAILAAMAPDPARRSGTARTLAEALAAARPRARRVPGVAVLALVAGALVAVVAATRPEPPAYPLVRLDGPDGPFLLGETEVDQALWREVTGEPLATRRHLSGDGLGPFCTAYRGIPMEGDDRPMVCVDWGDAVRFANALSERAGLRPAYRIGAVEEGVPAVTWDRAADGYRLPTQAEWQAALRDGGPLPAFADDLCDVANLGDVAYRLREAHFEPVPCLDGWPTTSPVRAFPADRAGLYGLVGNVSEWTWDEAPAGGAPGLRRSCGLAWPSAEMASFGADTCGALPAADRYETVGFRLARNAP